MIKISTVVRAIALPLFGVAMMALVAAPASAATERPSESQAASADLCNSLSMKFG